MKYYHLITFLQVLILAYSGELKCQEQKTAFTKVSVEQFVNYVSQEYTRNIFYPDAIADDSIFIESLKYNSITVSIISECFNQVGYDIFEYDENLYAIPENLNINVSYAENFENYIKTGKKLQQSYLKSFEVEEKEEEYKNIEYEIFKFGIKSKASKLKYSLSGTITDESTDEPIPWVSIQVNGTNIGSMTDEKGNYKLEVPKGHQEIVYVCVGMEKTRRQVEIYGNGSLNLKMKKKLNAIDEVVIKRRNDNKVQNMAMGSEKISMMEIKKMPLVMGEADVLKGVLSMPGVQTVSEVSTGFNVRGGNIDQNLVLLDQTPIMNSSHFFGFFSSFNADIVQDVTLTKSGIPASLGGRVSSFMDVKTRNGQKESFQLSGGISPITGRATIEGPLLNKKVTYIVSARSTYSDWVLKRVPNEQVKNSSAEFYDVLAKVNSTIGDNKTLSATFYKSYDYFNFDSISTSEYGNEAFSLNYYQKISDILTYNGDIGYSNYFFTTIDQTQYANEKRSKFSINQTTHKSKFHYFPDNKYIDITTGLDAVLYNTNPGTIEPYGAFSLKEYVDIEDEKGVETALFIQNKMNINYWLTVSAGLRYSVFGDLGPKTNYIYNNNFSKSDFSQIDSTILKKNEIGKIYAVPEFRLLAKIKTGQFSSIKASINQTAQYLSLLSNTTSSTPTDIWKLCDIHVKPQVGQQYSLGFYKDFPINQLVKISLSAETYYKHTNDIIDYKVGAQIMGKENIETELMTGINDSYGFEFQVNKSTGLFNGWFSYTYSRSLNKFENSFFEETLNNGKYIPANYDKPHAIKTFINYDIRKRLRISMSLNYATGRPVTLPEGSYHLNSLNDQISQRIFYSERNAYRLPDYFRVDMAATVDGRLKKKKLLDSSVTFSVINITGRKNPYAIAFINDSRGYIKPYALSIYGVPILTVTYNFHF